MCERPLTTLAVVLHSQFSQTSRTALVVGIKHMTGVKAKPGAAGSLSIPQRPFPGPSNGKGAHRKERKLPMLDVKQPMENEAIEAIAWGEGGRPGVCAGKAEEEADHGRGSPDFDKFAAASGGLNANLVASGLDEEVRRLGKVWCEGVVSARIASIRERRIDLNGDSPSLPLSERRIDLCGRPALIR